MNSGCLTLLIGAAIGGILGGLRGVVFGLVLAAIYRIRKALRGGLNAAAKGPSSEQTYERRRRAETHGASQARERAFCASAAAILAKMAKADGRVTESEIASVERAFARLGFSAAARRYAINVFREAKDDSRTVYEYARAFAEIVQDGPVREIFYGLLWDLARADGRISSEENEILERIPIYLEIDRNWYYFYARENRYARGARDRGRARGESHETPRAGNPLDEAYALLGVSPQASDAEVKAAYRNAAKRNHPDTLRAQGLPEALIGKANEKMARINEAWARIKEARGM